MSENVEKHIENNDVKMIILALLSRLSASFCISFTSIFVIHFLAHVFAGKNLWLAKTHGIALVFYLGNDISSVLDHFIITSTIAAEFKNLAKHETKIANFFYRAIQFFDGILHVSVKIEMQDINEIFSCCLLVYLVTNGNE